MGLKGWKDWLYKIRKQRRKPKATPIASQKTQLETLQAVGDVAQRIAFRYGKLAEIKRPVTTQGLSLVIRNIDENSRDEMVSVNTIQTAMEIASAASSFGMETIGHKQSGALHLTISPKDKEQAE